MKQKSPIDVVRIQFYTYAKQQTDDLSSVSKFPFDDRSDFIEDSSLGGSLRAATERWETSIPHGENCQLMESDDFDKVLDQFIAEQKQSPNQNAKRRQLSPESQIRIARMNPVLTIISCLRWTI